MTQITCPNCQNQFEPTDAVRVEIEKDLRKKMSDWQKQKDDEYKKKESQFALELQQKEALAAKQLKAMQDSMEQQLLAQKKALQQSVEQQLRKELSGDYENELRVLKENNAANEDKLKIARQKELEFLRLEQEIKNKEAAYELDTQLKLNAQRVELEALIRNDEAQKQSAKDLANLMRTKELETQLEQQKKLADEMRRRAEQGSMQLQGEAQELVLEDMLRSTFPFDVVSEVGKGVRGADCMLTVRNKLGQHCGKIIFESKRTQAFAADWVEKLKADLRSQTADVGVIVTQAMPKDLERFGEKDGIWICSFADVKALVYVLRDGILKVAAAQKNQENKGDKMVMLYDYLTGNEFNEQWKAIREGFWGMRQSIQKERDSMEKLWKAREKQLEKVLINVAHFKGSIEGISGQDFQLEFGDDDVALIE